MERGLAFYVVGGLYQLALPSSQREYGHVESEASRERGWRREYLIAQNGVYLAHQAAQTHSKHGFTGLRHTAHNIERFPVDELFAAICRSRDDAIKRATFVNSEVTSRLGPSKSFS